MWLKSDSKASAFFPNSGNIRLSSVIDRLCPADLSSRKWGAGLTSPAFRLAEMRQAQLSPWIAASPRVPVSG